jgi:hypothetical protein
MKKTIANAITAAVLISGAALASQPASAMGFKNCTGEQIRVKIYNNRDTMRAIAKRNRTLGVRDYHWFKLDSKLYQVRVYSSRTGIDKRVLLKGGLNGGHKFSIRKSRGSYSISTQNDCGSATIKPPKPGPTPIATIQVRQGVYVGKLKNGKRVSEVIRRVSNNAISVKRRGQGGQPVIYTLVGKDVYQNAGGSRIVVQSKKRLVWMNANGGNRVTYKHKG